MCPTIKCDNDDNNGIKLGSEFYTDTMTSDRIAEQTAKAMLHFPHIQRKKLLPKTDRQTDRGDLEISGCRQSKKSR